MSIVEAIVIAIVEGLTEFLPVSSTGHMVIASSLLGIGSSDFTKLFEVAIQLGAILAVVILYWQKFMRFSQWQFYVKLFVGVLPALIFGYLFNDKIDAMLESPLVVALSMVLGGIVLLFVDRLFKNPTIESDDQITYPKAALIGLWQVISMIPGVSRSAATIIGGMQQKLTRNLAAEFSFFLAVPTMFAATGYSLFLKKWSGDGMERHGYELITASSQNLMAFAVGNVVAFIVALLSIKLFINYLKVYGFRAFGVYRIALGLILLVLIAMGGL
ncbi:MAG: UDP-diphosphatase [Flaviaesturariibacter sp.]|nr:UDP-diphosphatase [Flaviaesturariibacter sp.]